MSKSFYNKIQQSQVINNNIDKIKNIINHYEISPFFANKLSNLIGIEIVLLCDDSGSMNSSGSYNILKGKTYTRWEELCERIKIIMEISMLYDSDGIDIYFINRQPSYNVKSKEEINYIFSELPSGSTELTSIFERILYEKKIVIEEKKLLVIIATDGEPTKYDKNGKSISGTKEFTNSLKYRNPINKIFVSIMACTNNKNTMKYLNKIDKNIEYVDVIDDYESEKKEILKVNGKNFVFNMGDYIVKTLVGPMDKELDNLDENKKCVIS